MKKKIFLLWYLFPMLLNCGQEKKVENKEDASLISSYGYIYNVSDATIKPGDAIPFDSQGLMSGVSHMSDSTDIIVNNAGIYLVNFLTQGTYAMSFVLFVNGIPVPGGSYESAPDLVDKMGKEYGQVLINLRAGDVISLRNYSPADGMGPAYLRAAGKPGKPLSVNASIVIVQIS